METIQKYDFKVKALEKSVNYKVKKLLELGLIKKESYGVYIVLPIPGYNRTTYTIRQNFTELICNCQGFGKRKYCSHTKAVMIYKQKTEQPEKQMRLF